MLNIIYILRHVVPLQKMVHLSEEWTETQVYSQGLFVRNSSLRNLMDRHYFLQI